MSGLYNKYIIQKADGTSTDPEGVYFVLRLDTDPFARQAAGTYAYACQEDNPQLAADLLHLLQVIEPQEKHRDLARSLRLAVMQQQYDLGNLMEEEARELLSGPLTPEDDTTIVDDSDLLVVRKP